jgi:hypothetical protein
MVIRIYNSYEGKIGQTIISEGCFICENNKNYIIMSLTAIKEFPKKRKKRKIGVPRKERL